MEDHLQLVSEAKEALDKVESDKSVSVEVILSSLFEIQKELETKIETLKENISSIFIGFYLGRK